MKKTIAHNARKLKSADGVYKSIRDAAKAYNLKEATVASRLRKGWTVNQSLQLVPSPKNNTRKGIKIICDGKDFKSITEFSKKYKCNFKNTFKRLKAGWRPEQAVGIEEPPARFRNRDGSPRNHMWKNPTYVDSKIFADTSTEDYKLYILTNTLNRKKYIGLTTGDLKARIRGHAHQAKKGRKSKLYNAIRKHGIEKFKVELAKIKITNLVQLQKEEIKLIKKYDTVKKGYNTAIGGALGSSKPIKVNGRKFPSMQSAAHHFNIDEKVFAIRVSRLGWSPEKAAGLKPREKHQPPKQKKIGRNKRSVSVSGKNFETLADAARAYDLNPNTVRNRINKLNWSLEKALEISYD